MGRSSGPERPASVERVRQQIERWRQTRSKRTAMPEPLWAAAVTLARRHGLYATSRDLHVSYDSLRTRLEDGSMREPETGHSAAPTFIELGAPVPLASAPAGTSVELTARDGTRLTVRLGAGEALDVAALVREFRGRRA